MTKKVVILNGSPRKIFNTAKLLQEAQKGAESTGANVEYFNLYDYCFLGCRSCFACQRKGSITNGVCAIRDEIQPILEKCINANAIIIGSPVYFSYPTGVFRSFTERLLFANHTYMVDKEHGGLKRRLDRVIPTGIIFTMNCPQELADKMSNFIDERNFLREMGTNAFEKANTAYSLKNNTDSIYKLIDNPENKEKDK